MFKFVTSIYKDYKRKQILEEERYFINKKSKYVLFSGTLFNQNGDIRHVNDLYFIIYLLSFYKIPKENITLVLDLDILEEFKNAAMYKDIYEFILHYTGEIVDVKNFEKTFVRNKKEDLIFIASGHGDINGLAIGKNQYLSSDYFEDIASSKKATLLIMSQCFAGAFHHLDTRKNICVLGASEYQTSLSLPISNLLNSNEIIALNDVYLNNFIKFGLAFRPEIPINPFIFSLFITLLKPQIIKSPNKHIINIYKNTAAQTLNYLNTQERYFRIDKVYEIDKEKEKEKEEGKEEEKIQVLYDSKKSIQQQPYLLNKIMAARFQLSA